MDTRTIKKLIELVKETGIDELEVKSGEESVRISCKTAPVIPANSGYQTFIEPRAPEPERKKAHSVEESSPREPEGHVVKAPMVGTVYLAATPGAEPFVSVGQHVKAGDTLCLIEAMKMFNKIEAEKTGVISARMIENEQPVEYDQMLFIIDTGE